MILSMFAELFRPFGGSFRFVNIVLLILVLFLINASIRNSIFRLLVSIISSSIFILEVCSLYFIKSFVGYQSYVHFNLRDAMGMLHLYVLPFFLFILLLFCIFLILFYSARIVIWIENKFLLRIFQSYYSQKLKMVLSLTFIVLALYVMTLNKGLIFSGLELRSMFNTNENNFKDILKEARMEDYVLPDEIKASSGKNIIVISLESLEKGYLNSKYEHLTPHISRLSKEWTFVPMQQNNGAQWTSGSLYAYMTGFPAYFGVEANSIFTKSYHSNISSVPCVLRQAGYEMSFIASNLEFGGEKDMLLALGITDIIDGNSEKRTLMDKDVFELAKDKVSCFESKKKPYALFLSTLDTHFPDGFYDKRMESYLPKQKNSLEFMVSAADYNFAGFISFLKSKGYLDNTVVYVFPDHLKMGDPSMFDSTGERSLYLMTNASSREIFENKKKEKIHQIDLPKIILSGANVKHNAKFLTEYLSEDKNAYIETNIRLLTNLNTSGFLRYGKDVYQPRLSIKYKQYALDSQRFIAHAGGEVNSDTYTNSLEALEVNYKKGFRKFELDINKTLDGIFVAVHDWDTWQSQTGFKGKLPPTHSDFLRYKIMRKYTPLDINRINQFFRENPLALLITDKVNTPREFAQEFIDKKRLMMELFTMDAVNEGLSIGILSAMPSQNVLMEIKGDKLKVLKSFGVRDVVISRMIIAENIKLLSDLKKNKINVYAYHINFDKGIDEDYVVKYEMDNIYGIYADKWDFKK